jgi:hypothetical protein
MIKAKNHIVMYLFAMLSTLIIGEALLEFFSAKVSLVLLITSTLLIAVVVRVSKQSYAIDVVNGVLLGTLVSSLMFS